MSWKTLIAAAGIGLGAVATSTAAPIASATYQGATFSIEFLTDNGDGTYDFKYVADFNSFTGTEDYIIGINFKPGAGTLTGSSNQSTTAAGAWHYGINTALSAADQSCGNDPGNNGFFCGSLGSNNANWGQNATTGSYDWLFTLTLGANGIDPGSLVANSPIRALFATFNANSQRWQNSLASLTTGNATGTVAEPATLVLMGLVLAAAGARLRRPR